MRAYLEDIGRPDLRYPASRGEPAASAQPTPLGILIEHGPFDDPTPRVICLAGRAGRFEVSRDGEVTLQLQGSDGLNVTVRLEPELALDLGLALERQAREVIWRLVISSMEHPPEWSEPVSPEPGR